LTTFVLNSTFSANVVTGAASGGIFARKACGNVFVGNNLQGNESNIGLIFPDTSGANTVVGNSNVIVDNGAYDCNGDGGNDPNIDRPDRDPPGRVGRLSFVTGSVSFRPGDVDDWVAATVNYPLHDGDHVWTDNDARAEITVGSTAFRLAPQTGFGFLALDDRA